MQHAVPRKQEITAAHRGAIGQVCGNSHNVLSSRLAHWTQRSADRWTSWRNARGVVVVHIGIGVWGIAAVLIRTMRLQEKNGKENEEKRSQDSNNNKNNVRLYGQIETDVCRCAHNI